MDKVKILELMVLWIQIRIRIESCHKKMDMMMKLQRGPTMVFNDYNTYHT